MVYSYGVKGVRLWGKVCSYGEEVYGYGEEVYGYGV